MTKGPFILDDEKTQDRLDSQAERLPTLERYQCDGCEEHFDDSLLIDKLLCVTCIDKLASFDYQAITMRQYETTLQQALSRLRDARSALDVMVDICQDEDLPETARTLRETAVELDQMAEKIEKVLK